MKRKKRVIIGMSGGVDSSVAAALLKKRGYDVVGMTLQLLPKEQQQTSACCNLSAVNDAKRVAYQLGIPHYTIDIRDAFQEQVINHFINSYHQGLTPNPCVECNRHIKFDHLIQKAQEIGFDYMATGHYCIRRKQNNQPYFTLSMGKDAHKDQSYFLYMMTQEQLKQTLFPLGALSKPKVRDLAASFGLITAGKKESQEICFVPKRYTDFLDQFSDTSSLKGDIVDESGKVLGTHRGIHHFTIGQSKGLGLGHHERLFVLKIDGIRKQVIVGPKSSLNGGIISVQNPSFIHPKSQVVGETFDLKIRYQMRPVRVSVLEQEKDQLVLKSHQQLHSISPGQSAVLYQGRRVIGGGVIQDK